MLKIAFIGAASYVFGSTILTDILTQPSLIEDTVIYLEDIDERYLDLMYKYMLKLKESYPERFDGVSFEKTTNQRKAIEDAKYIINAIHVGGYDAYELDMDIPYKYGVTQHVADTLGPGGVFRFLRAAPVLKSIMKDIQEVGYNSEGTIDKPLLINYTNPMAMVTWFCNNLAPDSTIGLCHGVFHTAQFLKNSLGVDPENFSYLCAGINHMAWFLELWYRKTKSSPWQNAYPKLNQQFEEHPEFEIMERLRIDMMKATGFFMTESSGHLSEYLPYYRKREDLLEKYKGANMIFSGLEHKFGYDFSKKNSEGLDRKINHKLNRKRLKMKKIVSEEYASLIMNAIETNKPFTFNGNVINKEAGLITNLPKGCCVEVPITADNQGLHPQGGIELPTVCQALCISNIMVQKAAIEGTLALDREKIYHAVLLDPNTASVCSPQEIRDMVDDMFEAEARWLPKF